MEFAEKLRELRKKGGYSQEELAEKMEVTRQSVSKWESGQSIPELDKILKLSEMFGVSTDYLLKDEIEIIEAVGKTNVEDTKTLKQISIEEAKKIIETKENTSKPIAFGVFLCIISPIVFLILSTISEIEGSRIPENIAYSVGIVTILILVSIAVSLFISNSSKNAEFKYLETEKFKLNVDAEEMVKEYKKNYKDKYIKSKIKGISLCVISSIPIFIGIAMESNTNIFGTITIPSLLVLVGIGVMYLIQSSIVWSSYEMLLQVGNYSDNKKEIQPIINAIDAVYWITTVAIYLGYSFITDDWESSWIIWPISGVLYPVIEIIIEMFNKKGESK